ncbi:MAG: redoxin domain-containing protein [Bacteroidetes bacterium]|nr:redoxin domain-containing protein [Bacteroidota bacterium]
MFTRIFSFIFIFFTACTLLPSPNKASRKDTLSTNSNFNTIQRVLDSLQNLGAKPKVTISTVTDSVVVSKSSISYVKEINSLVLDSLITNSKKKYTLIHCWASWCLPCKKELPEMIKREGTFNNTSFIYISLEVNTLSQQSVIDNYLTSINFTSANYIVENKDERIDLKNLNAINLIKNFKKDYNGSIPFNLLIENNNKRLVTFSNTFMDLSKKLN